MDVKEIVFRIKRELAHAEAELSYVQMSYEDWEAFQNHRRRIFELLDTLKGGESNAH